MQRCGAAAQLLGRPFAHRGLHGGRRPENSMPAFEEAVRRGFGIELDVRLSADGVPMVFHDSSLARVCGVDARIGDLRAAQLVRRRLDGSDATIPTLAGALHEIGGGQAPVLVDLKPTWGRRAALADAVAILLRCYDGPVAVVGFDPWLLAAIRARAPRVPRGQSAGVDPRIAARWWGRRVCHPVDELWSLPVSSPDFVTFNVDRLPSPALARARQRMPVVSWTVRTPAAYRLARSLTDGVIVEGAAVAVVEAELVPA